MRYTSPSSTLSPHHLFALSDFPTFMALNGAFFLSSKGSLPPLRDLVIFCQVMLNFQNSTSYFYIYAYFTGGYIFD